MASESGYSNQKKLGTAQFKTIHSVGGDKFGQSVASKALYEKTPEEPIAVTDVIGNSGQIEFLNIYYPSHNALVNDVLRMTLGAYSNFEFDVLSVIDGDNFLVLPLLPAIDISGDSGAIMAWVTNKANADGSQIVTLAPVPLQFVKDSTVINVNEDTVTSANNSALPANNFFKLDGVDVPVSKDSAIPANTIALPVEDVNVLEAVNTLNLLVQNVDTDPGTSAGVPVLAHDPSINEFKYLNVDPNNALKVSAADLPLPTGASTSALQGTGNTSLSSIDGKLQSNGFIDAGNSSVTPLGIGGVFTGTAFDVTKYASINVCLISDVPSATDGVKLEVSTDGVNWDHNHKTTYSAATGVGYIFNAEFKFARVVYTNGAVAQSYFRLQTIFKSTYVAPSLYTLDQTVTGAMFAQLNKSTIIGKTTGGGGGFVDVKVNPSGALTVEATLSAGTNNIGDVDVVSLPSLPAGTNNIGDVDVLSLPALPAGTNNIGDVDVASLPVSFGSGVIDSTTQRIVVANDQVLPISATALPLPTGAATDAKLDSIITAIGSTNTKLDSIELALSPQFSNFSTQAVFDSSAVTFTAPVLAQRMVIQNSLESSGPIRFVPSANTPSSTSGFYLGVGQSTSEMPAGSFKAIAVNSGEAGDVTVIWFV